MNQQFQLLLLRMIKESHTLIQEAHTTQEQPQWTQMLLFGKELRSMMERPMEKKSIKEMPMIFKLTVKSKRLLPTQDSHMPQQLKPQLQLLLLKIKKVFPMLMLQVITTQEQPQWIQMLLFGKEKKFTTVKSTEKNNTNKMPTISRHTVINKKQLPTLDFHIIQLPKKELHNQLRSK